MTASFFSFTYFIKLIQTIKKNPVYHYLAFKEIIVTSFAFPFIFYPKRKNFLTVFLYHQPFPPHQRIIYKQNMNHEVSKKEYKYFKSHKEKKRYANVASQAREDNIIDPHHIFQYKNTNNFFLIFVRIISRSVPSSAYTVEKKKLPSLTLIRAYESGYLTYTIKRRQIKHCISSREKRILL